MLQRLYVHNFRCLENFELRLDDLSSAALIGKNGTGKSTVRAALETLQCIARGTNRVGELVKPKHFPRGRTDVPIRFEIETVIDSRKYQYSLALELPEKFKELRVRSETLTADGAEVYTRDKAQVTYQNRDARFLVDWHLVALPIIQETSESDPISRFRNWLAHTIILAPVPSLMEGASASETLQPDSNANNFGDWFSGLLSRFPAAYTDIERFLREVMPDLKDFENEVIGKDTKNLRVRFQQENAGANIDFNDLSDGEKCFFLCAVALSASKRYGPLMCFWDEPDNYLAPSEVGFFVTALRRAFTYESQLLITSHNPEAIIKFSDENTFVLHRKSHLEPTLLTRLENVEVIGDLSEALILGDLSP